MKLATFIPPSSTHARVGLVSTDGHVVIDLVAATSRLGIRLPFDAHQMLSLIEAGPRALEAIRALPDMSEFALQLGTCRLLAPIPRPRKNVFCVGWNYQEHFEEGARGHPQVKSMPEHPTFFTKAPTAVSGPYDTIPFHGSVSTQLDWEAELGVVIGRGGLNLQEGSASEYIFGYLVVNDLSWRDVQRRHGQQWFKGKSLDGSCPMGPWITTADEVDAQRLSISCQVDGVTKQQSNTEHMYFKIPRIIAELSAGLSLEPGDMVSTGTPAGVGHSRNPPEFLSPGQVVETHIEHLGTLRNPVGHPPQQ